MRCYSWFVDRLPRFLSLYSGETGHRKADCDKGPLCYNCKVCCLLDVLGISSLGIASRSAHASRALSDA